MTKLPRMPVYVERLIADTVRLTPEEFGAYMRILLAMWLKGGQIEQADMRREAGVSRGRWARIWPRISGYFEIDQDAKICTQKRLFQIYSETLELHQANQRRAAKARMHIKRHSGAKVSPPRPPVTAPVSTTVKEPRRPVEPPVTVPSPAPSTASVTAQYAKAKGVGASLHTKLEAPTPHNVEDGSLRSRARSDDDGNVEPKPTPERRGDRADQGQVPEPERAVAGTKSGASSLYARLAAERQRRAAEDEKKGE